jgi:hypothetical protein
LREGSGIAIINQFRTRSRLFQRLAFPATIGVKRTILKARDS